TPTPAVLTSLAPTAAASAEALDPPELRAVWVDAFHDGFKTPQQVDDLAAWARDANLNALFVQVRRRGDAYYLKSFEPRVEDPDLTPGFDALQYLIERAHQGPRRLQIHAWLATLPIKPGESRAIQHPLRPGPVEPAGADRSAVDCLAPRAGHRAGPPDLPRRQGNQAQCRGHRRGRDLGQGTPERRRLGTPGPVCI